MEVGGKANMKIECKKMKKQLAAITSEENGSEIKERRQTNRKTRKKKRKHRCNEICKQ